MIIIIIRIHNVFANQLLRVEYGFSPQKINTGFSVNISPSPHRKIRAL